MTLEAGSRLGPYEIRSRLGAGGMGEVYRAFDTRLERDVAVKVLPAELSQSPDLQLRLEREAKTISQLNHPNICTLHDIGSENGTSFLVMELLDGETLAERLLRGPLSLPEVVRYGAEVAEGLERAHRAGIIHRDLKPGNIMLTKSGAKLLDFGLAKGAIVNLNLDGATEQKPLTKEGTILGTFQYMAPEQLEGLEADARSDIFSFGTVLYEMLTGKRAFDGKTKTSLIAAIVASQPPPISQVQPLTPSSLDHVVTLCLEKNPDDRWQSAHDIARELRWAVQSGDVKGAPSKRAPWMLPALIALALLAILASALYLKERNRPAPSISLSILPPRANSFGAAAVSPDGRTVAFVVGESRSEFHLWIRRVDAQDGERLTEKGSGVRVADPFWSPDGKWIAFYDHGSLMKMAVTGGKPELIARDASYGVGGTWNEAGTILFAKRFGDGLYRVSAGGGDAVRVTTLDTAHGETLHGWPVFLGEDHYLFVVHRNGDDRNEIVGAVLGSTVRRSILKADSLVGVWKENLLFVRDATMYAQPFDRKTFELNGQPQKIVDDVHFEEDSATSHASVSPSGAIVYFPAENDLRRVAVSWFDRSGKLVQPLFETVSPSAVFVSPDGSKAALLKWNPLKGANDLYVRDLERGVETRITGGQSNHRAVTWAPTSDRLYFSSDRKGMYDVYAQADDGVTPAVVLFGGGQDKDPTSVSSDGKSLLTNVDNTKSRDDVVVVPTSEAAGAHVVVSTEGEDSDAKFSPDGKWIVYQSDVSGREETYVRPFPEGRSVQVSIDGGTGGEWTADGREVIFSSADRTLMAVTVDTSGAVARPGKPAPLFKLPSNTAWWTLSPRTDRILLAVAVDAREAVGVANYVTGWWK